MDRQSRNHPTANRPDTERSEDRIGYMGRKGKRGQRAPLHLGKALMNLPALAMAMFVGPLDRLAPRSGTLAVGLGRRVGICKIYRPVVGQAS